MENLRCPSSAKGMCPYALNSGWELNSAPGTVMLFESEPGWNQVAGREAFTFDNHYPRGGCVVLWSYDLRDRVMRRIEDPNTYERPDSEESEFEYDVVKFIRSEEELNALRWE